MLMIYLTFIVSDVMAIIRFRKGKKRSDCSMFFTLTLTPDNCMHRYYSFISTFNCKTFFFTHPTTLHYISKIPSLQ
jgi:hypothetical protein